MLQFEPVKAAIDYLKGVRLELMQVVWPKREEVIKLTLTVILISAIVGVYLGAVDFGFTKLLEFLVNR